MSKKTLKDLFEEYIIKSDDEVRAEFTRNQRLKRRLVKKDILRKLMITLIAFGIVRYGSYLLSKNLNDYIDRTNGE